MDKLTFVKENQERIQTVENSFGPSGRPLSKLDRVLMGEGRLIKQGRRKPEPKAFFLFNDVLVYGSIILNGRWHKNQKIIPLEDIQLEDMEDGATLRNQWLIRTPCKSFFVSAPSYKEKRAWMDHIEDCRSKLLQTGNCQPSSTFAISWIPDQGSYKCMRCLSKFTTTKRRHHCRKCGFLVCNSCSKTRAVIGNIHPSKKLRVCSFCHTSMEDGSRQRGDSTGKNSSEEDDVAASSDDEVEEEMIQNHSPSNWLDTRMGTWGQLHTPDQYISHPSKT
ncbi:pleckstrin homology domain-containing family F member 2-like [Lates japonicus]|uniref:Pleckstrin homology domain-containing family F member 2-like protein n=1 Tax=Lates japonicus TaxID=270547 RepID=A0AAD3R981_LATJO|nr:pleckstrin homology domain-containing family F member 2-like protein [Lates japonicus]